ncbi:MAG: GNAT family N-acetyltransferase [Clostridia bacterium]|nr:GNAT family N-acetyltransferase [Clostridia bacterium]
MEFLIRELRIEDSERFVTLQKEFLKQMDEYTVGYKFSEGHIFYNEYDSDEDNPLFVVVDGNTIIAYADTKYEEDYVEISDTCLCVTEIFVLKEYQGKCVGKLLIEKVLEHARKKQIDFIHCFVLPKNNQAQNFLLKFGFVEHGKESYVMNVKTTY